MNDSANTGKKHLYNSRLSKVKWFANRFGVREIALKPLRVIFAPLILSGIPRREFVFQGRSLPYLLHRYNMTWASERCVEVPIALHYLESMSGKNVLEVGNVLSHYQQVSHDVLDKFEKGPAVINEDILTFSPKKKYDLILSISTFEHIGFDDESEEPSGKKILAAIEACRRLLSTTGKLIVTVPIDYNPDLDRLILEGSLGASEEFYVVRTGFTEWRESDKTTAMKCRYKKPFPYANAVMVASFPAR